jgi:hypothetical protein
MKPLPPSPLSSRPERSVAEGPAVPRTTTGNAAVPLNQPQFRAQAHAKIINNLQRHKISCSGIWFLTLLLCDCFELGTRKCGWFNGIAGFPVVVRGTAGPSAALRSGRDDKGKDGDGFINSGCSIEVFLNLIWTSLKFNRPCGTS